MTNNPTRSPSPPYFGDPFTNADHLISSLKNGTASLNDESKKEDFNAQQIQNGHNKKIPSYVQKPGPYNYINPNFISPVKEGVSTASDDEEYVLKHPPKERDYVLRTSGTGNGQTTTQRTIYVNPQKINQLNAEKEHFRKNATADFNNVNVNSSNIVPNAAQKHGQNIQNLSQNYKIINKSMAESKEMNVKEQQLIENNKYDGRDYDDRNPNDRFPIDQRYQNTENYKTESFKPEHHRRGMHETEFAKSGPPSFPPSDLKNYRSTTPTTDKLSASRGRTPPSPRVLHPSDEKRRQSSGEDYILKGGYKMEKQPRSREEDFRPAPPEYRRRELSPEQRRSPGRTRSPERRGVRSPERRHLEHKYPPPNMPPSDFRANQPAPMGVHLDPRSLDPRNLEPRKFDPRNIDPRSVDPRSIDPRNIDPRAIDPRGIDPRLVDPRLIDPRKFDPRNIDPRHLDPRNLDPRDLNPRDLNPRDLDRRPIDPRFDPKYHHSLHSEPNHNEFRRHPEYRGPELRTPDRSRENPLMAPPLMDSREMERMRQLYGPPPGHPDYRGPPLDLRIPEKRILNPQYADYARSPSYRRSRSRTPPQHRQMRSKSRSLSPKRARKTTTSKQASPREERVSKGGRVGPPDTDQMFGNSPPRSKDQRIEIETDSDRKQEKSKKKSKKRKKESTEKPVKTPETAIIGATYKPRDLSVNMEKDIDLPLDQIRKVLWEDYDGSTQYGKNFIVPVRGYFCRLCSKFYQSESAAVDKHTRSETHFKNLKKLLTMTSQEANTKKRMTQVEKQRAAHAKKVSEAEKKWQENNELTPLVVNHEANQLNNEMSQVNGLGMIERNPPPAVVNVAQNIVDNGNLHVIQNNHQQQQQVQHMETDQAQNNNNQAQKKSYQNYKFHTQKNIFEKTVQSYETSQTLTASPKRTVKRSETTQASVFKVTTAEPRNEIQSLPDLPQTVKLSLEQKNPFGGSKPMKVTVKPDSKLFKQQQRQQAVENVNSEFLANVQAQNRMQQLAQSAARKITQQPKKPDMAKFFSGDF